MQTRKHMWKTLDMHRYMYVRMHHTTWRRPVVFNVYALYFLRPCVCNVHSTGVQRYAKRSSTRLARVVGETGSLVALVTFLTLKAYTYNHLMLIIFYVVKGTLCDV